MHMKHAFKVLHSFSGADVSQPCLTSKCMLRVGFDSIFPWSQKELIASTVVDVFVAFKIIQDYSLVSERIMHLSARSSRWVVSIMTWSCARDMTDTKRQDTKVYS